LKEWGPSAYIFKQKHKHMDKKSVGLNTTILPKSQRVLGGKKMYHLELDEDFEEDWTEEEEFEEEEWPEEEEEEWPEEEEEFEEEEW